MTVFAEQGIWFCFDFQSWRRRSIGCPLCTVTANADKGYGLTNEGFRGMGIKKDMQYNFSLLARQQEGNTSIRVELVDEQGNVIGETTIIQQEISGRNILPVLRQQRPNQKPSLMSGLKERVS